MSSGRGSRTPSRAVMPPRRRTHSSARMRNGGAPGDPRRMAEAGVPAWTAIERAVIDGVFRFAPAHARAVGDHAYDGIVGDVSAPAIAARASEIARQFGVLAEAEHLKPGEDIDRRAL